VEAFLIKKAMARYGNVSHAARALGLSRCPLPPARAICFSRPYGHFSVTSAAPQRTIPPFYASARGAEKPRATSIVA
jgi:hypothetical protein